MNEHKVFPYLLECFINLSSQQQEEGHQFLQEILNLFLKNTDTGPGYTQLLREAVNPVYSIYYTPQGEEVRVTKDKKELRIFLQGYVGEAREPLETPEQI